MVKDAGMPNADSDEREQRPLAGILFLLLGTTVFPLQDVIIKTLSTDYAVHQIVFLRGLFAAPVVLFIVWVTGDMRDMRIGSFWLQMIKAAGGFTSYFVYYMALAAIGMAETSAITFSTPLFVTVMAIFFLSEKIGLQRWLAVIMGLVGVVVVIQPGASVFEPAAVLALLAAVFYASSIIATRKLGNRSNGGTTTLFTLVFFIIAGGIVGLIFQGQETTSTHPSLQFLYRAWFWPEGSEWLYFIALGVISGVGFYALTQAYRIADASVVTPFEYTYILWTVLWGYVFFGALPAMTTWIGLILIVGSGLFIVYREADKGRSVVLKKGLGILRQR
ncbi:MAG: DMT family transporter [Rhodospirillales bacterium]|nr:DMT family transporter [Rhodospirillales bacterium]MBT4040839.1 DMT family transporter [Rhodospirillales bacterium]MBT4625391.1 DMT family transporter [Rhodospirillales bacterium]MBT5351928.1 DMT family transporter [Rhodospirillales bacterium]MBT5521159.1 DMT family transporter [Rhodospirillales bacterium]